MLTIHAAGLLLPGGGREPVPGGAVAVRGREIAAVGPYEELTGRHPQARVRRWPGVLTPGLVNLYGPELLEQAYHPDPREAGELGTGPLVGAALAALDMSAVRWGASARRGVQRMLAHGTVAVAGDLWRESVVDAVVRAGLTIEERFADPPGPPSLDPFAGRPTADAFLPPPLAHEGTAARFAVFDVADEAELAARGAGTCVATVLDGRLVYRAR